MLRQLFEEPLPQRQILAPMRRHAVALYQVGCASFFCAVTYAGFVTGVVDRVVSGVALLVICASSGGLFLLKGAGATVLLCRTSPRSLPCWLALQA